MRDSSLLKFSAHSELKTGLLVECCTGIVEVKGPNPIQARIFSGFLFTTAKIASLTATIEFYIILHPAVPIYELFITTSIIIIVG